MTPPIREEALRVGDKVKLILDKEQSPDNQYHGKTGTIIDIEFDDADSITGDPRDNFIYQVELENGEVPGLHFRHRDLELLE